MIAPLRHYWRVMTYACDRCGHRVPFYLEDGCEGPRDREAPPPGAWVRMYGSGPGKLPKTTPQTADGRFVLPVPFVAAGCPRCQRAMPWNPRAGVLQHVDFSADRNVDTTEPPANAGRFHYPSDWMAYHACGVPVLPTGAAA